MEQDASRRFVFQGSLVHVDPGNRGRFDEAGQEDARCRARGDGFEHHDQGDRERPRGRAGRDAR